MFSKTTPIREWGKQDGAEGKVEVWCSSNKGFGGSHGNLLPFRGVSNWGKTILYFTPTNLLVIEVGLWEGCQPGWNSSLCQGNILKGTQQWTRGRQQSQWQRTQVSAMGLKEGSGQCTTAFTTFEEEAESRQILCCRYSVWEVIPGSKSRDRRLEKGEAKPVQKRALQWFAALEDSYLTPFDRGWRQGRYTCPCFWVSHAWVLGMPREGAVGLHLSEACRRQSRVGWKGSTKGI